MNGSEGATDAREYPGLERWRGAVDEKLTGIGENIARLERAIENMTTTVMAAIKEVKDSKDKKDEDFEKRIAALEIAHNYVRAKVALFAGLAGLIGGGLSSAAWGVVFHRMFP